MQTITTATDLINVLSNAKANGQFVTIYGETDVKLNKFPTDGSERVRIKDGFAPRKRFSVTYNFAADYEKKMSKVLGTDYTAHDANRIHLLKNVVMQYVSTSTICLIYMPNDYKSQGTYVNGLPITDEDAAYMARYKSKASQNNAVVEYRTIGLKNVREIHINKEVYKIDLKPTATAVA